MTKSALLLRQAGGIGDTLPFLSLSLLFPPFPTSLSLPPSLFLSNHLSLPPSLYLSPSFSLPLTLSLYLSPSFSPFLPPSLPPSLSLSLPLSHTLTNTLTIKQTYSPLPHAQTFMLHLYTHIDCYIHILSHTHPHSDTHRHTQSWWSPNNPSLRGLSQKVKIFIPTSGGWLLAMIWSIRYFLLVSYAISSPSLALRGVQEWRNRLSLALGNEISFDTFIF